VFLGVCLVVRVWGVSKARRARVAGVVGVVLVLVLVPVVREGYCVDHCPHFHHHQRRQPPPSARSPNWEGIERLTTISEDSHDEGCEPRRSTGCRTFDSPHRQGTQPPKR